MHNTSWKSDQRKCYICNNKVKINIYEADAEMGS